MLARKVKLNLNKKQKKEIKDLFTKCMHLYNILLQKNFDRLNEGKKILTAFDMISLCRNENLYLEVSSDIKDQLCQRLYKALENWQESQKIKLKFWLIYGANYIKPLKSVLAKEKKKLWGAPRFKTKPISIKFLLRKTSQSTVRVFGKQTAIRVPRIGVLKGWNDRQDIIGLVKQVSIHADSCGTFWATIVCDGKKPVEKFSSKNVDMGVDLGLKHTITAANENHVIQPERDRFLDKQIQAIANSSRNNKRDLPFIHRKIARRRKHSHHVQAKQLIEAAENIYIGNLKSAFLFSGKLARSASDAAHSQFLSILSFKAENAGKIVKFVDEKYTSQICYACKRKQKMTLEEREYICVCGYSNNRDVNAALNILQMGREITPRS